MEESGFATQDKAIARLTEIYNAKKAAPRGQAKADRIARYGSMRFEEYSTQWRAGQRDLGPASVAHLESLLNIHLLPLLGSRRMNTFDHKVVEGFLQILERNGVGLAAQANAFDKLKAILLDANRLGLFDDNHGGGGASALIAACADSVMRAATAQAERAGGRLDPPMLAILDEAANVCKISDLPDLYSHLGSRGIIPITILQSYRQGQKVWGDAGMDAMWSASTVKVIGSGIDDPDFADKLSRLIGDHDVETRSTSHSESGKSTSVSMRQERILPADAIRALPKGTALCFATGMRAAMLDLRPWYLEPGADELSAASSRASKAITTRAIAKAASDQGDFGPTA